MNVAAQLAKHFRQVYFGGNWTSVNIKEVLAGLSWQHATQNIHSCNSILALVYHMNYYVIAIKEVLEGRALTAKDKFSFEHPQVQSEEDWQKLLNKVFEEAETFARLVEQLPEGRLWETFSDEKYGNYFRNITGVIEHLHYHLGQIVIIKKMMIDPVNTLAQPANG